MWGLLGLAVAAGVAGYVFRARHAGLPSRGSSAYEQATRSFYRGLAEMQVGLLDVAVQSFRQATTSAPGEPAAWANLALAQLRLGETDAAAPALAKAASLARSNSAIAFLEGRLEASRGAHDASVAAYRRAIELDARNFVARTALIQEIESGGTPEADAEAQQRLEELFTLQPENLSVIVDRARIAAKRGDAARLRESLAHLDPFAGGWPPEVVEQYRAATQSSDASDTAAAARELAFLRNTLAAVPAYRDSRDAVTAPAELVADPFTSFLRLPTPESTPAEADMALTFASAPLTAGTPTPASRVFAFSLDGEQAPAIFAAGANQIARVDAAGPSIPATDVADVLALDWNNDFRTDALVADANGLHLWLQSAGGAFVDRTAAASEASGGAAYDAAGVWAADVDLDGDLDVVAGIRNAEPVVLRNNGDGTWQPVRPFSGVVGARAFAWGDVDRDGDPDAVFVDANGALRVLANMQAGRFQEMTGPAHRSDVVALAVADVDADGVFDVVTLDRGGAIRRASFDRDTGGWTETDLAAWAGPMDAESLGAARVSIADVDNNGALDLVVSNSGTTAVWLAGPDRRWHALSGAIDLQTAAVVDLDGDGQLDLAGVANSRPVRLLGQGTRGYHYQVVRPHAQEAAGDQRINTFGIGGEIETRSGLLAQKQIITSPAVHIGLGTHTSVDVTRILWPNGVIQADFDSGADQTVVAQQRLKGSCPWVFADNGHGMAFVTDFLWRSPLGLRINAQDTAGITQTEDWIRIRGDQLAARNGAYDVRITAELWETHFIDHVSLLAVDHPSDVNVYVDERFAREAPALAVHAMRPPRPVAQAWDQTGRDVTDLVRADDGRYLDTFDRGAYQGVATDHSVEIDLGAPIPRDGRTWLVARGWVYPTDSSINVAIGQGRRVTPRGLSLEARDARGRWITVASDLGFPSGKNKTVLIDLDRVRRAGVEGARRLRLRTNLEIYWDSIAIAAGVPDAPVKTTRVAPSVADLRYRGYSVTRTARHSDPEVPVYDRVANIMPRWRDLTGFYTRFGDVRELLATVDDRYVIMNAGDELRFSFPAPPAPPEGWTRDFVLIGDGWVKDGDYNTTFSKTVLPLPAHGHPDYDAPGLVPSLATDPVYQRHRDDWTTYQTRFVVPDAFVKGLR
jgi:tetratricopeptide (TPR) repeat protein